MTKHLELPDLKLSTELISEIANLNWHTLELALGVTRVFYLKHLLLYCWREKVSPWGFFSNGGPLSFGNLMTYRFPKHIEDAILKELQPYLKNIKENPTVRLQLIYGGKQIAVHVDPTRSISLIYPIKNHDTAYTTFYEPVAPLPSKGAVNPLNCRQIGAIKIANTPAMFEVNKPHSVNYTLGTLTKDNPRISLSIKWSKSTFNQIKKQFNENSN